MEHVHGVSKHTESPPLKSHADEMNEADGLNDVDKFSVAIPL